MFKKMIVLAASSLLISSNLCGLQSSDITYDWLTAHAIETNYTDHIYHWRRLFNTMKIRGFLECGCGYSTAYFMNNAEKVISIEYITPGYGDAWYQYCLTLFPDRTKWIPMTYNETFRSNSFNNACAYQCSTHRDYALIDPTYLNELSEHFSTLIAKAELEGYEIDIAFVDPGVYIRGDLVKLLLAKQIPIVVAHDTATDFGTNEKRNLYGWNKVHTPSNYVKIYIPFGQGTTFWINDQLTTVIESMQRYREAILELQESGEELTPDVLTNLADLP